MSGGIASAGVSVKTGGGIDVLDLASGMWKKRGSSGIAGAGGGMSRLALAARLAPKTGSSSSATIMSGSISMTSTSWSALSAFGLASGMDRPTTAMPFGSLHD